MKRRPLPTMANTDARVVAITEICRRLNVTTMTTTIWRHGTKTRRPLPTLYGYSGTRLRVGISEPELLAWLHQYRPDLIAVWNATRT